MPNSNRQTSPYVEFAKLHGGDFNSYLNAQTALWRCDDLLDDLKSLRIAQETAEQVDGIRLPYFGFHITSYYSVGFVTCLEWHARSRITDSIEHDPSNIKAKHLEKISNELLAQIMREKVTVASVIGATVRITSFDQYSDIFTKRVLEPLGINIDPRSLLESVSDSAYEQAGISRETSIINLVNELFDFRHSLVHEIGPGIAGAWLQKNCWDIDTAVQAGLAVKLIIQEVEKKITEKAAPDFPNILDGEFMLVPQDQALEEQVDGLEEQITNAIEKNEDSEVLQCWKSVVLHEKKLAQAKEEFMHGASFGDYRFFSPRAELRITSLKHRLSYLLQLFSDIPTQYEEEGIVDQTSTDRD